MPDAPLFFGDLLCFVISKLVCENISFLDNKNHISEMGISYL